VYDYHHSATFWLFYFSRVGTQQHSDLEFGPLLATRVFLGSIKGYILFHVALAKVLLVDLPDYPF